MSELVCVAKASGPAQITSTRNGLPGTCWSPHLTTSTCCPRSRTVYETRKRRLPTCFTVTSSAGAVGPSAPIRSIFVPPTPRADASTVNEAGLPTYTLEPEIS